MVDGGREVCLRLFGDLDADCRDELRHELYDAVHDNRAPMLVVDLHDTAVLGSEAIGTLLEGFLLARQAGKTPQIINARGAVRTVLQVTGVLELFGATAESSARLGGGTGAPVLPLPTRDGTGTAGGSLRQAT
ncbi:STAS domain-containing protein [Couchioplanes caeruleus]|uniref:STAS domain-containing protein n=1 Tax=Couchioplanes caeruleus TaxID=56438 RepID=UPI0020BE7F99|nr:STAS domain-containing protein [Couchioplanes caeruleus]UQU62126.1 STAS domain-containing protein [Couchioplanes caeruleus]